MFFQRYFRINYLLLICLVLLCLPGSVSAAACPVDRLQESFTASARSRKKIYDDVIRLGEAGSADSTARLARAVALTQRAMDKEDLFIDRMIATAPGFRNIPRTGAPFFEDYRAAMAAFDSLADIFPWAAPYAGATRIVAENRDHGPGLFRQSVMFRENHPSSRFWKRLLLLSGCRLLLEKNYIQAQAAFNALWRDAPASRQAIKACRLVEAMKGHKGIRLTPEQMLEWGKAQGLAGSSTLRKLIERYPNSKEAELACIQSFRNIDRGFSGRSLSRNFRRADRMEKDYSRFIKAFPSSPYLEQALLFRAQFNFKCGKKSHAIARKNDYSWRKYRNRTRKRTATKYGGYADKYFARVESADSIARALFPGTETCFRIRLLSARTLIERDRFNEALAKLTALLDESPDTVNETGIRWFAGLIHYLKGDCRRAAALLSPLEKSSYRDSYYWGRGMLFLGKSYLAIGDNLSAGRVFTYLSRVFPYTYQGIRARYLRGQLPVQEPQKWVAGVPVVDIPEFRRDYTPLGRRVQNEAAGWQSLGFYAEAAYIYSNGVSQAPDDLLLRFRKHENFLFAGAYHRVLNSFRGAFREFLQRGGTGLPDNFWKVAYLNPEPYVGTISRHSAARNMPPELVTAIIRQESNFHPRAGSHAGAMGLMQLLPSVGRRLARNMGMGRISARQLYDPDVNIRIGIKFMATNLKKFKGNIAPAISCYNADPRNLPAWLERSKPEKRSNGEFDLDLFIELIPLDETRNYNILVLSNFWRYQELYGGRSDLFCWRLSPFFTG